jgi:hypothetical protein
MNDEYGEITNPDYGRWIHNETAGVAPRSDIDPRLLPVSEKLLNDEVIVELFDKDEQ